MADARVVNVQLPNPLLEVHCIRHSNNRVRVTPQQVHLCLSNADALGSELIEMYPALQLASPLFTMLQV